MKWMWWWRHNKPPNGEAAKRASKAASDELRDARGSQSSQVDETTRVAREVVRRTDLFAREIERAMRPRGTA